MHRLARIPAHVSPRHRRTVYFPPVCRPFSRNAVYLRWNVISRVTDTDTAGVTAIFRVSPRILPEKRIPSLRACFLFCFFPFSCRCGWITPPVDAPRVFSPPFRTERAIFDTESHDTKQPSRLFSRRVAKRRKARRPVIACEKRAQTGSSAVSPWNEECACRGERILVFQLTTGVVSVAKLEKAGPRTTRKLFTAHLSRPRSPAPAA